MVSHADALFRLGFIGKIGFEYSATQVFEYSNIIRIRVGIIIFQFKSDFFFDLNQILKKI